MQYTFLKDKTEIGRYLKVNLTLKCIKLKYYCSGYHKNIWLILGC